MRSFPKPDHGNVFVVGDNGTVRKVPPKSEAADAVRRWRRQYGGRPLSPALKATTYAQYLAAYDRNLIDRIEAGGPELQKKFAIWCACRAFSRAGLTSFDWLNDSLKKMDAGVLATIEIEQALHRFERDTEVPVTLVSGVPGESEQVQQLAAFNALVPDMKDESDGKPLHAAIQAYRAATKVYGMEYKQLLDAAKEEF